MTNHLPADIAPAPEELESNGLYQALRARGVHIRLARQRIGAKGATRAEARLLDEKLNAPLLTMARTAFDDSGTAAMRGRLPEARREPPAPADRMDHRPAIPHPGTTMSTRPADLVRCHPDPARLGPFRDLVVPNQYLLDPYFGQSGIPDTGYGMGNVWTRAVAYSCGHLTRDDAPLDHLHDPAELALCERAKATPPTRSRATTTLTVRASIKGSSPTSAAVCRAGSTLIGPRNCPP